MPSFELPSLHRLSLSEPVGDRAGRSRWLPLYSRKVNQWNDWFQEKLEEVASSDLQTQVEAMKVLDEYWARGVGHVNGGSFLYFSGDFRAVWKAMAEPYKNSAIPALDIPAEKASTYVLAVALAWFLETNKGDAYIGDHCGDDWECMRKVNDFKEWFSARRRVVAKGGPARAKASAEVKKYVTDGSRFKGSDPSLSGLKEEDARFVKEVVESYGGAAIPNFAPASSAGAWVELLAVGWLQAKA